MSHEITLYDQKGVKHPGIVRTTYLIDEKGYIEKALGNVKAADNPSDMLEAIS